MPVYFIDQESIAPPQITVQGPLARHLASSLRLCPGEQCWFVDETSRRYLSTLTSVTPSTVVASILRTENAPPPLRQVTIGQALLKGSRMDWVLQKSTELGATKIIPLITERTIVHPRPARIPHQLERWRAILRDAAQQAGRSDQPVLEHPVDLHHCLSQAPGETERIILWEAENQTLLGRHLESLPAHQPLLILAGPEGGFSQKEVDMCVDQGVHPVSLGPLILRAETATLAALATVQACSRLDSTGREGPSL